jgi:hypothetical protein
MELLLMLVVFAGIGYILATSRVDAQAGKAAEKLALASRDSAGRFRDGWKIRIARRSFSREFRDWVNKNAPALVPESFRSWLSELSAGELQDFVKNLADYSHGLSYSLSSLVEGELETDPRMRQVFVEAITVYSAAYRKAKEARKASEAEESSDSAEKHGNGRVPAAEKAASRRTAENTGEVVEPASSD